LEIRFELTENTLEIYRPDGRRFLTPVEMDQLREQERQEKELAQAQQERQEKELAQAQAQQERQRAEEAIAQLEQERQRYQTLLQQIQQPTIDPDPSN
jgi:chromosome segregation ATPase